MIPNTLITTTSEILKIALKSSQPTDITVSKLLREKKYIGSKERRFISETIFACLRNLSLLENCYISNMELMPEVQKDLSMNLVLGLIIISENDNQGWKYSPNELLSLIYPNKEISITQFVSDILLNNFNLTIEQITNWIENTNFNVKKLSATLTDANNNYSINHIANLYSCPAWILEDVAKRGYSPLEFAMSLNKPANVCIRLSDMSNSDIIIGMLNNKSIPYHFSKYIKECIILDKRAKIDDTDEYKAGLFEIQDEGSQMIGYAVSPTGSCTILDACAGAGGKTLHLAKLNPDAQEIVASDSEFLRIKEFSKRLRRYNKTNITVKHASSMKQTHLQNLFGGMLFDYVLIDAPCTGLGTARRDPLKKYRITQKIADKMHHKQIEILTAYSKFVKPDGVLVYATCSVVSNENEKTVERFLTENSDFEPDNLYSILADNIVLPEGINPDDYSLSLMPYIHGTDGFYMARMKRTS